MKTAQGFRPPDRHGQEQIGAILAGSFTLEIEEPVIETWAFYDTFGWRLFNKSLVLQQLHDSRPLAQKIWRNQVSKKVK
jgi:hypothetical protein